MLQSGQHTPDFPVFSLGQRDIENGSLFVMRFEHHFFRPHETFGKVDAFANFLQGFVIDGTGDEDAVHLPDTETWMGQLLGQGSIIGQQQEPFAVHVKPADRKKTSKFRRQQINGAFAALLIGMRTKIAFRFEKENIGPLYLRQCFAVDTDFMPGRIHFCSELRDRFPVDLNTSGDNQFLARATASESGGRENFLKTLSVGQGHLGGRRGRTRRFRLSRRRMSRSFGMWIAAFRKTCAGFSGRRMRRFLFHLYYSNMKTVDYKTPAAYVPPGIKARKGEMGCLRKMVWMRKNSRCKALMKFRR